MSQLSYEPNTVKNGHLTQKLEPLKDRRFLENPLSHPHKEYTKLLVHHGFELGYFSILRNFRGTFRVLKVNIMKIEIKGFPEHQKSSESMN